MSELKEKLRQLIDNTSDSVALENIYRYLNQSVAQNSKDILDDLSTKDLNLLHESMAQYRRGEFRSHEEILQLLKEWRGK